MLLASLTHNGGHAWMVNSVTKAIKSTSTTSSLRYHTKAALQYRCGGSDNTLGKLSGLLRARQQRPRVPFWTSAAVSSSLASTTTSTCLFQSTAAVPDAETIISSSSSTATVPSASGTTRIVANNFEFVKPDPDQRQYRWIKLANNLEVLLVSTTDTTTSSDEDDADGGDLSHVEAAAVHVQAGHFDDTIPGVS